MRIRSSIKKYRNELLSQNSKEVDIMPYTYRLRTDKMQDEDGEEYIAYGIEAVDSDGKILEWAPDIFFDRQKAENLVILCIEEKLEVIHLMDVAEDALFDY